MGEIMITVTTMAMTARGVTMRIFASFSLPGRMMKTMGYSDT